ncbi:mrna splicing protein yju2 [Ophiostoma piceae UAMH 11346]|uniref:Splicing factor YJU2 n=1 Tax=Ophiostoma piceae (strain UAMH 11346) TaxID=1262450 RepID=S3CHF6_OPHP1|nr:mrna splicing protein yju2 [Ophiostoma piceae UAMH 11346]
MSERKVLSKYYPPDFDPSALTKRRNKKQKEGPNVQTVRLMSPMSMRCTRCGEFIYKGRKFNARKEKPESENYLGIQIYRFYIRCTRCSGEIIFRTDPKNQDYAIVSGAKRNVEPWRQTIDETDEQRLDRLEAEQAEEAGDAAAEQNRMEELEAKTLEAKREMDVADALDEIRTRNARIARADHREHLETVALARPTSEEELLRQQDEEDAKAAREAFAAARADVEAEVEDATEPEPAPAPAVLDKVATIEHIPLEEDAPRPAAQSLKVQARRPKKKTDFAAKLGIKIKK